MTKIEWAEQVWNPVTGCTKVSSGCKNCYAETMANRFWGERKFTDVQCHSDRLSHPLKWKKPRRVFVNSMSDLFHEKVPFEFIAEVFRVMWDTEQHTYQILTKRADRMLEFITLQADQESWPLPNVWFGVSVEDQATADERIPLLLQTPAAVRWVSAEPLLGSIFMSLRAMESIDWLVVGGESGPYARPMHPDWARSLRDQCQAAHVPFFFKQWGSWWPNVHKTETEFTKFRMHVFEDGLHTYYIGKKAAGRVLDGKIYDEYPAKGMFG